jgi:hypothetical protein
MSPEPHAPGSDGPFETVRRILQTGKEMAEAAQSSTDASTAAYCRQAARRLYWSARSVLDRADPTDPVAIALVADAAELDLILVNSVA